MSPYTSAHDLAVFLASLHAKQAGEKPLSGTAIAEMANVQGRLFGTLFWGLGTTLYVWDEEGAEVIGHDGRNHPAINTTARLHRLSGDGIIVLTAGTIDIASKIGDRGQYGEPVKMSITDLPERITWILIIFVSIVALFLAAWLVLQKRRFRGTVRGHSSL